MSLGHSPSVVTNGLVMYYDMNNTKKSWLGKPITNLISNGNFLSGAIAPWGTYNVVPIVVTPTALPYTRFNSNAMQFTSTTGTSGASLNVSGFCTIGQVYTFSFYGRILSGATSTGLNFNNQNGSGDVNAWSTSVTLTSSWQKFTFSFTYDVAKTTLYFYHGITGITSQFTEFQLEQSAFATPFVNGTRLNTQALVDLTSNNTLTTTLTYASNNTFSFNGTSNWLDVASNTNTCLQNNQQTISMWVNINSVGPNGEALVYGVSGGAAQTWIGWTPGGVNFWAGSNATLVSISSANSYSQWMHVTYIIDRVGLTFTLYKNGVYVGVVSFTTYTPSATTVTIGKNTRTGNAGDFTNGSISNMQLYNRTLTAAEVAQNFNALRGRYGI